jgi:hypothetical protein
MNKWIGLSLGGILGLSHIGLIGLVANRNQFPQLNLPIGDYTSYQVEAGKDGYRIQYRANDPKVMEVTKDVQRPAGFLGFGKAEVHSKQEYTMEGSFHLSDRSGSKMSAAQRECIEAAGGGKQTGRIVGGSVGAAVGTSGLASIPYVGWVLAGAATVLGMEQGAEIGGNMATDFSKACQEHEESVK